MAAFLQKRRLLGLLAALAALLALASIVRLMRRDDSAPEPTTTTDGAPPARPNRPDRPDRPRETEPSAAGPGHAPSASASEAVAALVGDASLSDAEALAGLQRIVEDAARPLPERLEALDHVINLVSDEDPQALHELAARRVQPDEVRARLVAESLNRPARVRGDLLVVLLDNAAGELRQEVLAELKGLLGEDLGDDPAAWRAAVDQMPADP